MEGGDLRIQIDREGNVELEGPAEEICIGTFSAELTARLSAMGER